MFFFRFRLIFLQLMRAWEIIRILSSQGMKDYVTKTKWIKRFFSKKRKAQYRERSTEERIRLIIEELGPTYIKFGQILADRPDVVSESLRKELKRLQSRAFPMDDQLALELIEKELGKDISEVFIEFDKRHLASASIGQAYMAKLITGERVIIKIQRPNIEAKIKLDLVLMRYLAKRAVKNYPDLAYIDLIGLIDEFGQTLLRELNYLNESANIIRFGEMFKTDPKVYIPHVFTEYCTRRILVMEFIDGIPPDETERLLKAGNDLQEVALNGADAILQMIFLHGYFHADPHPGNIFVMKNNVVSFIDFGMVGTLKPVHMNFLASFILGFAKKDSKMLTKALLELCGKKFYEYSEELEFEIEDLIKRNSYLPYQKVDFSVILQECINTVLKYKLKIPSSIYLLLKALATVQRFAEKLSPNISFAETVMPYAKNLVKAKYSPKKLAGELYNAIGDYVSLIRNLPIELNEILGKIKDGKLVHEINIHDTKPFIKLIRVITQRISLALLIAALIICSTVLMVSDSENGFARGLFTVSVIISGFMVLRYIFKGSEDE